MIQVAISVPRFRKRLQRQIGPDQTAGQLADVVAAECAYGSGDHSFVVDETGRHLDRDERLTKYVGHKDKLTLILR